jgi:hypothetical protein
MFINGEQADGIRKKAVEFVTGVLDFYRGDLVYQDVCKGYTPGYGTSCTFLPHWMLLKLGVSGLNMSRGVPNKKDVPPKPRSLINRDDLSRGTKLVAGDGVSVIANSPAFVTMKPNLKAYPQPGDIVIIQKEPYNQPDEHVFVFLGKLADNLWDTGESGQAPSNSPDGTLEGKRKKREMRITDRSMIAVATPDKPVDRKVQGWLDISKLDYVEGSV